MNDWCDEHHRESGLLTEIRNSTISVSEAEAQTLDYLETYIEPGTAPLCGNSIGQDRRFLYEYMPRLTHFLHYRNIDVSSVKELVKRWYPSDYHAPEKEGNHRANDDIRESIEELRWYRQMVFLEH
jgi:oligoribonuclease